MPATIELTDARLVVHVEGADRIWAIAHRLEVGLANIVGAEPARADARRCLHGIRLGGQARPRGDHRRPVLVTRSAGGNRSAIERRGAQILRRFSPGNDAASIPARSSSAGRRMNRFGVQAAAGDQPRRHRVGVPHLACG